MAFELVQSDTVVVGEFNRAIIRPDWLQQNGIIASDLTAEVFLSDEPAPPRQFKFAGYEWEVGFSRLQIKPIETPFASAGQLAAQVLGHLPHTPVRAVGHNFLFSDTELHDASIAFNQRGLSEIATTINLATPVEQRWGIVASQQDVRISITFISDGSGSRFALNFHQIASDAHDAAKRAERETQHRDQASIIVSLISEGHK
jgi:hypothetical protein